MSDEIEIIPNQAHRMVPAFATHEDYQRFRDGYIADVGPKLEKAQAAARASWDDAHWRVVR